MCVCVCVGGLNVDNPHRDGTTVCRDGKMNKGMVEWTNMSNINCSIKNSKISGNYENAKKNVRLTSTNPLSVDNK